MLELFKPILAIGLEKTPTTIRKAVVSSTQGKLKLEELTEIKLENWDLVSLSKGSPFIATGLDSSDILTRSLTLPLKKEKDIDDALSFQAEPLLPYPVDQAILTWVKTELNDEGTGVLFFAARKDKLESHIEEWKRFHVEPEIISSETVGLSDFGSFYLSVDQPYYLIHLGEKNTTCVLMQGKQFLGAHTMPEGFGTVDETNPSEALQRMERSVIKMVYALGKETRGVPVETGLITGEGVSHSVIMNNLYQKLNLKPLEITDPSWPSIELQKFALPIGLALNALKDNPNNFRKESFAYPNPWKRMLLPVILYLALSIALSSVLYLFGQTYLDREETGLKQKYVELLGEMNKSYESFEKTFLAKNPAAREKNEGEVVEISKLTREDLMERIDYLQKELKSAPDSFPLYANVPRVSDVLAWLSTHPNAVGADNESKIQIESLNYTLVKRPTQAKKNEKYQVKIDLEFTSPTPTTAREFHDALIAPNDFVDPKAEVKWGSNRGKYRTSFYLKDKTQYPGQ